MSALNCNGIRQAMLSGVALLNVRTADEFDSSALPDAKNIPLAILPPLAHERLDKNKPVLIHCSASGRAIIAEKILQALGFSDVTSIGSVRHYRQCQ